MCAYTTEHSQHAALKISDTQPNNIFTNAD